MRSAMARRLAVAAALAVLAGTAGCGGGGGGGGETVEEPSARSSSSAGSDEESEWAPSEDTATATPSDAGGGQEGEGTIFPGSETEKPRASPLKLPRTKVGEETTGTASVGAPSANLSKPLNTVNGVYIEIEGQSIPPTNTCVGESDDCTVVFQYTPTEPGPYTGLMTVSLSNGATLTAPISGEAVADEGPTSTPPTSVAPPTTPSENEEVPPEDTPPSPEEDADELVPE
ncbi:hypothetical protein RKD23_003112 [Streptomyces sp. SAI-170]|uniref:hypothetical protein n=1 Tax=Streptomyces sp. SAI-170 TaxID=3377729 RepID=UPI003C7EAC5A